jgi:hypothetical protein
MTELVPAVLQEPAPTEPYRVLSCPGKKAGLESSLVPDHDVALVVDGPRTLQVNGAHQ